VEDDVNPIQRSLPGTAVADVAFDEVDLARHPVRFARAVGLSLQVVEDAHIPAGSQRAIDDVRADEPGASGDQRGTGVMG
jgi:hypothetical protein